MQRLGLISLILAGILVCAAPNAKAQCIGDCDGDCAASISELMRGVCISLSLDCPFPCTHAFDANGNGVVAINELIVAVHHALNGCPDDCVPVPTCAPPTPTPVFSPTPLEFPVPGCCEFRDGSCEDQEGVEILLCLPSGLGGQFFEFHSCDQNTGRCVPPTPRPLCIPPR